MTQTSRINIVQQLGLTSYEMSTAINLAQRAFRELLTTCLGHHGLTIPQWTLLGQLYEHGPMRPMVASKMLSIKPPYVAKLVQELELQGIVSTVLFPDDGRGKAMSLTQKGTALVEQVESKLSICLNEQLGELKQDDLKTYFVLTNYIATHVHHMAD